MDDNFIDDDYLDDPFGESNNEETKIEETKQAAPILDVTELLKMAGRKETQDTGRSPRPLDKISDGYDDLNFGGPPDTVDKAELEKKSEEIDEEIDDDYEEDFDDDEFKSEGKGTGADPFEKSGNLGGSQKSGDLNQATFQYNFDDKVSEKGLLGKKDGALTGALPSR